MDAVFQALGHPTRRILLEELAAHNDQTLFQLTVGLINKHHLEISRQAVTKHLAILREAGLVTASSRGRTTVHHLDPAPLSAAREWLTRFPQPTTTKEEP
jgi:DNA-binding transcriptional ArsR family regulator